MRHDCEHTREIFPRWYAAEASNSIMRQILKLGLHKTLTETEQSPKADLIVANLMLYS
jgi:hypothetical protein